MLIYKDGEFEVIVHRNSLVIINRAGEYENHSHVQKKKKNGTFDISICKQVIEYVKYEKIPHKIPLCKACARLTLDDRYRLTLEQKIDRYKENKYINVNKGAQRLRA